jgi:hypothetical protein
LLAAAADREATVRPARDGAGRSRRMPEFDIDFDTDYTSTGAPKGFDTKFLGMNLSGSQVSPADRTTRSGADVWPGFSRANPRSAGKEVAKPMSGSGHNN